MLNYKEIVDELNEEKIKLLLDKLDIPYQETNDYILMPTVCHNTDINEASWKLYYYKNNHLFYCYTECGGQSIFKFLEHFYEARDLDYDWYKDVYLVAQNCSNYSNDFNTLERYKAIRNKYKEHHAPELPTYSAAVLDTFIKQYPIEWLKDGISKEAMDKFDIRYSISQNRIIIPHYDVHGRLIGIRGRALNPWEIENIGKYMPVKIEQTIYKHPLSMNLYGLYENIENIRETGIVCIAEGEKSVLQAESYDIPNCVVAACGSSINIFQIKLLMREARPQHIIVCFDKEQDKTDEYFNKLWNMCSKYKKYCDISFVYDRENLLDAKESPFDKGEDVFKKLIERRVKI